MNSLHTLASRPYETALTIFLGLCVLASVRTLSRARRVYGRVRAHGNERDAELWSRTQVRIEWCILAAQCLTLALSVHRITTNIWDEARVSTAFQVYGTLRVVVAALLAWCVLANKRACEELQRSKP